MTTQKEQNRQNLSAMSNEELCILVQQGNQDAQAQLLLQNDGMIHTIAWRERKRYAYLSLEDRKSTRLNSSH